MSNTATGQTPFIESIQYLIQFLSREPLQWASMLPPRVSSVRYKARGTPLSFEWPLFAVIYELWYLLDSCIGLDCTDPRDDALREMRVIFDLIWDCGAQGVNWDVGNADRWDDYWLLVHKLARE